LRLLRLVLRWQRKHGWRRIHPERGRLDYSALRYLTHISYRLANLEAEEGGGGKVDIIKAGYFKDVDISLMSHPTTFDGCFVPCFAIEMFEAEFFGKAAHAVNSIEVKLTLVWSTVGRHQCSRCDDFGIQ
jgi:hypothetical protein